DSPDPVSLPIPISHLAHRYFLYSPPNIAYLRRHHNVCGVLIGSLPQVPSQNVFMGLPLELMPEEARVLVERGVAYIVDDVAAHREGLEKLKTADGAERRREYMRLLRDVGRKDAEEVMRKKEEVRRGALERAAKKRAEQQKKNGEDVGAEQRVEGGDAQDVDDGTELFSQRSGSVASRPSIPTESYNFITPTSSSPLFDVPPSSECASTSPAAIPVPDSYPLFAHLHANGYFLFPGMRFGCNYVAYPGDPLRFHSHFLSRGVKWN
ncbi:hypothetical protein P152DRAFT_453651, partial [Eremomyces bilateralis CBS 781.70]